MWGLIPMLYLDLNTEPTFVRAQNLCPLYSGMNADISFKVEFYLVMHDAMHVSMYAAVPTAHCAIIV